MRGIYKIVIILIFIYLFIIIIFLSLHLLYLFIKKIHIILATKYITYIYNSITNNFLKNMKFFFEEHEKHKKNLFLQKLILDLNTIPFLFQVYTIYQTHF